MTDYFPMLHRYREKLNKLSRAEVGNIVMALLTYSELGTRPDDLNDIEQIYFDFMADNIDQAAKKHEVKSQNGSRGGRPKKEETETEKEKADENTENQQETEKNLGFHIKSYQIKSDQVKSDQVKKETDASVSPPAPKKREEKHRHGENGHVLLTDSEYDSLKAEYPNADEAVEYLDAYIAEKDYKAKSHYLSIKRWVFDALREQAVKKAALTEKERRYGEKPPDEGRLDFNLEDIFEKPSPKET